MKQLSYKLVFPLTVISFFIFTKWWYTLPVDAPDTIFIGFPLPYLCDGWHTSLSLQVFLFEFFIDLLLYFLCWFVLVYLINRFLITIKIRRGLAIFLLSVSGLIIFFSIWVVSFEENLFYFKRGFTMEIMETGYKFIWQSQERPDYLKYHPQKNNESAR